MKLKLLGGVALALVIGASSSAWANPKNSFADNNTITVTSNATVTAIAGDTNSNSVGRDCRTCGSASTNRADGSAWSESFNTSIEGVDHQILTASTSNNFQHTFATVANTNDNNGNANNNDDANGYIQNGNANATGSGAGLNVAGAAAGVGNLNLQAVSIGAGANVNF